VHPFLVILPNYDVKILFNFIRIHKYEKFYYFFFFKAVSLPKYRKIFSQQSSIHFNLSQILLYCCFLKYLILSGQSWADDMISLIFVIKL